MPEELYGARFESRWVVVGGLRVHARMSLSPVPLGPPVVLVHGLVVASTYLMPTAARLAERFRVFVPELPGFGRSERPKRPLSMSGLADALAGWMDAMDLARAAFLANSNGCQVVAALAERWPDRVERAVLTSPTIDPAGRSLLRQLGRWIVNSTREPPSLLPVLLKDYRAAGVRQSLGALRETFRDRIEERLPHVEAPTLVVRGERDPVVPQAWAERAARLLKAGDLVVIPGAPHTLNWDVPGALCEVAVPFLEGRELHEEAARPLGSVGLSP